MSSEGAKAFIARWAAAGASERAKPAEAGEILETLCAVGKARHGKTDGTYLP